MVISTWEGGAVQSNGQETAGHGVRSMGPDAPLAAKTLPRLGCLSKWQDSQVEALSKPRLQTDGGRRQRSVLDRPVTQQNAGLQPAWEGQLCADHPGSGSRCESLPRGQAGALSLSSHPVPGCQEGKGACGRCRPPDNSLSRSLPCSRVGPMLGGWDSGPGYSTVLAASP